MAPSFDFTNEDAWQPAAGTILEARREPYVCWIDSADQGDSSGGHPQLELQLREVDGAGEIRDWLVITPASLGKVVMLTDAVGIENPGQIDIPSDEWSAYVRRLVGRKVGVYVRAEADYNDPSKTRSRVAGYTDTGDVDQGQPAAASSPDDEIPF